MIPELAVGLLLSTLTALLLKSNHQLRKMNLELQIKLVYIEGDLKTARETLQTAKPVLNQLSKRISASDPLMPGVVHAHASVKVVSDALERGIERFKGIRQTDQTAAA